MNSDLISRSALKATIMSKANGMEDLWDTAGVLNAINNAPTVDEREGEWIKGREISREMINDTTLWIDYENFTCSNCGLVLDNLLYHVDGSPFYKFCPHCGAKMKEVDNESHHYS